MMMSRANEEDQPFHSNRQYIPHAQQMQAIAYILTRFLEAQCTFLSNATCLLAHHSSASHPATPSDHQAVVQNQKVQYHPPLDQSMTLYPTSSHKVPPQAMTSPPPAMPLPPQPPSATYIVNACASTANSASCLSIHSFTRSCGSSPSFSTA
jgi:hypothetical protein